MKNPKNVWPALVALVVLAIIGGGMYFSKQDHSIKVISPDNSEVRPLMNGLTVEWNQSYTPFSQPKAPVEAIEISVVDQTSGAIVYRTNVSAGKGDHMIFITKDSLKGVVSGRLYTAQVCDTTALPVLCDSHSFSFSANVSSTEPVPYIGSISPQSVRKGDIVSITGSGLNGFEGDVYFFFERADGKTARLPGILSEQINSDAKGAQTVRITLKEPCQAGQTVYGDYSGKPSVCDYVELVPGTYKVYTKPWDMVSNAVSLTIIK